MDLAWLVDASAPQTLVDHVGLVAEDGLAVVTLDRPEQHNALSLGSWRQIRHIFDELTETDVSAVVVRGAGERAFGAGADITEFPERRLTVADAVSYNEAVAAALRSIVRCPAPVIAMIRGLAVGGGCELAAACDVRIAERDAKLGIPIGRLGVVLGHAEAEVLVGLIGAAALKHLLFSGRLIDADEALRIGLVQQVVEPDALVPAVTDLVAAILASSRITIRAAKAVADMCARPLTSTDTERLSRIVLEAYDGADLKEGVAAFLEGRSPQFPTAREGRYGRS